MITEGDLSTAVAEFWAARETGTQSGRHDKAFLNLIARELEALGVRPHVATHAGDREAVVPGHFRAAKSWDIVCRDSAGEVRACIEFKSQVDSYGNNENNRYEEALGSGLDVRASHGKDVALGFVFVLCDEQATTRPTRDRAEGLDPAFAQTSHVDRRRTFLNRITDFRLNEMPFYDAAAMLLVTRAGSFRDLGDSNLDIRTFAERLMRATLS